MDRNVRRVVAAAVVVAASCNVYDPSLLVGGGGSGSGATGGKGSGGSSGKGGSGGSSGGSSGMGGTEAGGTAGRGGTGGTNTAGNGGASSGRGGSGGSSGSGNAAGTGGSEPVSGAGGEGGEAGMGPVTGGTGGQGGTAGKGGSGGAGAGGKAGNGGTGGAGNGGAGSGGAGNGGTAGAATATGCAKLTVPLNEATDQARFAISLSGNQDLSATNTTITMVLFIAAGNGGVAAPYVQDKDFHLLRSAATTALSGTGTWKTITWNVPAEPPGSTGIVLTTTIRIGIQIWANGVATGLVNPSVVYVDSISVNTPSLSYPLTTTSTVDPTPASSHENSPGIMWLNNYEEDTLPETLTGTALAWQATCP